MTGAGAWTATHSSMTRTSTAIPGGEAAVAAGSASAAMMARVGVQARVGAQAQASVLTVDLASDHGVTGAEDIMTGGQASVVHGTEAAEVEWASACNYLYRKKPCNAGLFV